MARGMVAPDRCAFARAFTSAEAFLSRRSAAKTEATATQPRANPQPTTHNPLPTTISMVCGVAMVYNSHMIVPKLLWRFVTQVNCRVLWRAAIRCGLGNLLALHRFQRRLKKGVVFPPFLFISMTNRCNLRCTGCWVSTEAPPADLAAQKGGKFRRKSAKT